MNVPTYVVTDPDTGYKHLTSWGPGFEWFCICGATEANGVPCYGVKSMIHSFGGCIDTNGKTFEYLEPEPFYGVLPQPVKTFVREYRADGWTDYPIDDYRAVHPDWFDEDGMC